MSGVSIVLALIGIVLTAFTAMTGYLQLRTAHLKLVLDLFERRKAVYDEVLAAAVPVVQSGDANMESFVRFGRAVEAARFMFGNDVYEYVETIRKTMAALHATHAQLPAMPAGPERTKLVEANTSALQAVAGIFNELPRLAAPYMKMAQRVDDVPWLLQSWGGR